MLGRTLSHYRVLEKIGEGGMGVVYRARDERLERDVALKVLPPEMLTDAIALNSFRKEAQTLSRLNHPNIATIHDFDTQEGISFLVMEYIAGTTLNQKLAADFLSQKEVIRIGVQLAQGLHAAHSEGVIHRDLKPSNLRVTPDWRLKILDFGLAKLVKLKDLDETQSVTSSPVAGTLPYMAPEQLQGEPADVRSDIYSAGAVLYEMVTRRRPFTDAHGPQLINAIIHSLPAPPIERNRHVSAGMQRIILKSLDKDPNQRYQSARELQVDLERLNGASTHLEPPADQSRVYPLEIAHILFMDVVGYSLFPMDQQRVLLRELQQSVCSDSEFVRAKSSDQLISLPTGDGMALVFFGDPEAPCKCALQMSSTLRNHPEIKLRMGIHTGPIYRVPDINASRNVAGSGINIAQRVMDCGDSGHILVSKAVADVLSQLRTWAGSIHDLGETEVKHGLKIHLFNLYTADSGNPEPPTKLKSARVSKKLESSKGKTAATRSSPRHLANKPIPRAKPSTQPQTQAPTQPRASTAKLIRVSTLTALLLMSITALTVPAIRQRIVDSVLNKSKVPAGVPSLANGHYLAVLPFVVHGDPNKLRFIADGLDEALATKLFTVQDLSVASSEATKKVDLMQSVQSIAGRLGVNLVVKGIVEGTLGGIRITVTLDDVPDNKHLWKKQFPGTSADVLFLEDQIYKGILEALNLAPSEIEEQRPPIQPTDNTDAYNLYLNGRAAFLTHPDTKSLNTAIGFYEAALKKDPRFALACARLADAQLAMYHETRDSLWIRKAEESAKQAQLLNDRLPEAHIALGTVYGETGQTDEAISQLKRALQLSPKSDEGYRRLGTLYREAGRKDQAIRAFQIATTINPFYFMNYNELGNAYAQFGENDKAQEAYANVIRLDKDNYLGYMNVGNVFFNQGRYPEAITQYLRALELQSDDNIYSNLSAAYFYLGRYAEAVKSGQKAVEMRPNDELAVGNLAAAYFWSGDKKKAMETYDRAIALANTDLDVNPKNANTFGDLAVYTAKRGDTQRAMYYIGRARKILPTDPTLLSFEAQIHLMAGRPNQALESLQSAFESGYPVEQAKLDPELGDLRGNPQFEKLLQKASARTSR